MLCNIYLITNLKNNKKYVGKTVNKLKRRMSEHVYDAIHYRYNSALHAAIRKYGRNSFKIELIETCDNVISNERESYWIDYYDTYKNGYNSTLGGDGKPIIESPDKDELEKLIEDGLTVAEIGRHYGVYGCTVKVWLDNYNIEYELHNQIIKVGAVINGVELKFNSLSSVGRYLIDNGYTLAKNEYSVGYNVKRAIERKGTYLDIKWYYI